MPSNYVPWIVLQVLTSTPTSRGSLRPPKWRPKAKNGQKIAVFGLDQPILVWRPPSSGPNSGIHRRTYNSKRYPPYFEPFCLQTSNTGEKKHKLAYIPIIQYTYTKKMFLTKTSCLKLISYHSMDVSGTYHNPFQGSQGPQEGSEAEILTFWPKKSFYGNAHISGTIRPTGLAQVSKRPLDQGLRAWPFRLSVFTLVSKIAYVLSSPCIFHGMGQNFKMAVFARFRFLKSKNPISGHN